MDDGSRFPPGLTLTMGGVPRDSRLWCLYLAFLATLLALIPPRFSREQNVFSHIFVVDITRSMNVEDIRRAGKTLSRLAFVKQAITSVLGDLPCGSRIGLGVFTERHSTLLFEPVEICAGYNEVVKAVDHLDWRMAWAADSRVSKGLLNALEWTGHLGGNLVFFTDGHEAPPMNPRYRTSFDSVKGAVKGLLIGVGGPRPTPIPKIDVTGKRIGFYTVDDIPHRSTFGLPPKKPSEIEGYNARNAPFGSERVIGAEHLSSLREAYLKKLSFESGLDYQRLETPEKLSEALRTSRLGEKQTVAVDMSHIPAIVALLTLLVLYLFIPWSNSVIKSF